MRKLSRLALATLFAGALAIPAAAEEGVTDTEIVLGSHTALSGPVSAWGIGSTEGTRMRFDEASARYAEFGPFYVSYVMTPAAVLDHCRVGGT